MIFNQASEEIFIHYVGDHIPDVNETVLEDLGYTLLSMKVSGIEAVHQRAHEERPRREPDGVDVDGDPRLPRNDAREIGR